MDGGLLVFPVVQNRGIMGYINRSGQGSPMLVGHTCQPDVPDQATGRLSPLSSVGPIFNGNYNGRRNNGCHGIQTMEQKSAGPESEVNCRKYVPVFVLRRRKKNCR